MPKPKNDDTDEEVRAKLLLQIAEKNRMASMANSRAKTYVCAAFLLVGLAEIYLSYTYLADGPSSCEYSFEWWLCLDGAAVLVGMLLGIVTLRKTAAVAAAAPVQHWLIPEGKDGDWSHDLTRTFKLIRSLSDVSDTILIISFIVGWYWWYCDGRGCDAGVSVWWVLVMKITAPTVVSVLILINDWLL